MLQKLIVLKITLQLKNNQNGHVLLNGAIVRGGYSHSLGASYSVSFIKMTCDAAPACHQTVVVTNHIKSVGHCKSEDEGTHNYYKRNIIFAS